MPQAEITLKVAESITKLRKEQGLTQEEVAKKLGMQRASYAQFEVGNRSLSTLELISLSKELKFSLPKFLSDVFDVSMGVEIVKPVFNYRKFKSVFLYILNQCKSKNNVGKVVLYKLLYFSDFNYYEQYNIFLTGSTYSKLPMGPVPAIDHYIQEMKECSEIKEVEVDYFTRKAIRYIPNVKPDMRELSQSELTIIDNVLNKYSNMNATEISNISHDDAPWLETENLYDEINYGLVYSRPKGHNF